MVYQASEPWDSRETSTPQYSCHPMENKGDGLDEEHLWLLGDCLQYLLLPLAIVLVSILSLCSGFSKDLTDAFGCSGWDTNTVEKSFLIHFKIAFLPV